MKKRRRILKMNTNPKPPKMSTTLLIMVILSVLIFVFFFFILGDTASKMAGIITPIACISFALYGFFKEKSDNKRAASKREGMENGDYYRSAEWQEKLMEYKLKHPWQAPHPKGMRYELAKFYRRREYVGEMAVALFLIIAVPFYALDGILKKDLSWELIAGGPLAFVLGVWLFRSGWNAFTAKPVRDFYKKGYDYAPIEESFRMGQILTFKTSGVNMGSTCLHAWTGKKVWNTNYEIIRSITRKNVRVKHYDDNIYSHDEYEYYIAVNVILPDSGKPFSYEIKLDEYQVELVIEEFSRRKQPASQAAETAETYQNHVH